ARSWTRSRGSTGGAAPGLVASCRPARGASRGRSPRSRGRSWRDVGFSWTRIPSSAIVRQMQDLRQYSLRLGDRISADRGLYRHVGIVSGCLPDGTVLVLSGSKQKRVVVEETIHEFADGQQVRNDGFDSHLPRDVVVWQFRRMLGQPWTLLGSNCEHYVAVAEGKQPSSP